MRSGAFRLFVLESTMTNDTSKSIGEWYSENIHRFPDLVSGHCEYCGDTEMIIEYDDGSHECYFCGSTAKVVV